jgi:two-component system, NarL family, sensor kinase
MPRLPVAFFISILLFTGQAVGAQTSKADSIVAFLVRSLNAPSESPTLTTHQTKKLDSLNRAIANAKSDSVRASTLIILGDFYLDDIGNYPLARYFYDSSLHYGAQLPGTFINSSAQWGRGNSYYYQGNYVPAIEAYQEAYIGLGVSGLDTKTMLSHQSTLLGNLGAAYTLINEWEEGQLNYFESIKKLEEINDTSQFAITYYNISFLFSDMNDWEKAYEYIKKSLPYRSSQITTNISNNSRMSYVCTKLQRLEESATYLNFAEADLRLLENEGVHHKHLSLLEYYSAKGVYDYAKGRNILATQYLLRAYKEAVLHEDPYWVAVQARELALLYFRIGNLNDAKIFFHIALDVAKRFGYKAQVLTVYSDLSEFEKEQGHWEQAVQYRDNQLLYYDSVIKQQNHSRILLNEAKYQSERRQNEISQLKKDNQIQALKARQNDIVIYSLIAISVMVIFSSVITYRNLKQKQNLLEQNEKLQVQKINQLENEKQLMASEAVIKGQEEERGRLAKDLHDGLGGLLSGVKFSLTNMKSNVILNTENALLFERSIDMLDHSISELRRVAHNMMPEVLIKFGLTEALKSYCDALIQAKILAINYQVIGLKERLPSNVEIILYRIIQELLNNTVKHAKATQVLLQLALHEKELNITLEDNGVGFDINSLSKSAGSGLGNIRSRVEYLKGKLDIQTSVGKGTSVLITFAIT